MERGVGEDLAGAADQRGPFAALAAPLLLAMREIFGDDRGVLIGGRRRLLLGQHVDAGLVPALVEGDVQPPRHQPLLHVAAAAAAGPDADQIDRAVADVVVAVAAEILGREFPVAGHAPFLDAAQDLGCRPRCRPSRRGVRSR